MSSINGDKARFNRDRKGKIARRARNRKLLQGLSPAAKPAVENKAAEKSGKQVSA